MGTNGVPVILRASDVNALLPMPSLIRAMEEAFAVSTSRPMRLVIPANAHDWVVMPGLQPGGSFVCKLLRVGDGRVTEPRLATIAGVVLMFGSSGDLQAVIDAGAFTAARTAAVAAFATERLARPDASVLALFGTGALAASHLQALSLVRPLSRVYVVGRSSARTAAFVESAGLDGVETSAATPDEALEAADLVVTVTTSREPVFDDRRLRSGTHINAMGSYRPDRREIPGESVGRARIVVETRESAWEEAGDLIQARRDGLISDASIVAALDEGTDLDRVRGGDADAITLFKSVGNVAFDLVALSLLSGQIGLGGNDE